MRIEQLLESRGLVLPEPVKPPPGVAVRFAWARVFGDRAYLSCHSAQNRAGSIAGPFGRVGAVVAP